MNARPFRGGLFVFKGRHFDQSVILLCVRWYLAYNLSPRDLEEMMAECGICVDHSTIHRWVLRFSPLLLERFNRRKRAVTDKWQLDETYEKVRGRWMYLYRAIDSVGDTVEFFFSEHRNLLAAKGFTRKALKRHDRPERAFIDGSQTNREAITRLRWGKPLAGPVPTSGEAHPHPAKSISQQSHRAGSPAHRASDPINARIQVHHQHRNDPVQEREENPQGFRGRELHCSCFAR